MQNGLGLGWCINKSWGGEHNAASRPWFGPVFRCWSVSLLSKACMLHICGSCSSSPLSNSTSPKTMCVWRGSFTFTQHVHSAHLETWAVAASAETITGNLKLSHTSSYLLDHIDFLSIPAHHMLILSISVHCVTVSTSWFSTLNLLFCRC